MKSKQILLIEVGAQTIRACQFTQKGKRRLAKSLNAFEFANELTTQDLEGAFSRLLEAAPDEVIISLSRAFFLVRFIELPSQDVDETRKMLPFQLGKVAPFSLDEALFDFCTAETKDGLSKLTVFLIQKKKITTLLKVIAEKKITPAFITMNSWGLAKWFSFQERFISSRPKGLVAIVNIDKGATDVVVVQKAEVVFSRSFSCGDDEEIIKGIHQSLEIFKKEFPHLAISKIVFTGRERKEAREGLGLGETLFINDREHFSIAKDIEVSDEAFSYASLLGLMTPHKKHELDFSPHSVTQKRQYVRSRKKIFEVALVGVELIIIVALFSFKYVFDRYTHRGNIDTKLQEIKVEAEELDALSSKLRIIEREFGDKVPFSEVLNVVVSSIPQSIELTLLEFREEGSFSIRGYAQEMSDVFAVVKALNTHPVFDEVKPKYASKIKRRGQTIVEFYIEGRGQF